MMHDRDRTAIMGLAARHKIPAIYSSRQYVIDGGLMSCAASVDDTWQQVGVYTARLLKGAKPADRHAANQVRPGAQSQSRHGARPDRAADAARHRRRGDRIIFVVVQ
jgi:hypothetical protein